MRGGVYQGVWRGGERRGYADKASEERIRVMCVRNVGGGTKTSDERWVYDENPGSRMTAGDAGS